jgi:glycosyltransferase involved in cell wall biosynthesis
MNNLENNSFDIVFVTSLPSFYKINLYNKIAQEKSIYVIFIASSSQIRTKDFVEFEADFDYDILYDGNIEEKNSTIPILINIINKIQYSKIILGGWDFIEYWIVAFISNMSLNAVAIESSIYESKTEGLVSYIKKIFLSRISTAFVSGKLQKELMHSLKFNGNIITTGGVGLFNIQKMKQTNKEFQSKFLYVGRLSQEKNLIKLIEVFNELSNLTLTIVGKGELKASLEVLANDNIRLIEHIPNQEIANLYINNNVLILPSSSEPWGLVVEEALYYGLPVIVSDKVGCGYDMVKRYDSGIVFEIDKEDDLKESIKKMIKEYARYKQNVSQIDFDKVSQNQINSYL